MLRKIRIVLALVFLSGISLLFLDLTGILHRWLAWMSKLQFIPAVLALNVVAVAFLVILTFLFGRVYCSVICPLGVFQDIVSWLSGKRRGKRFRFRFRKPATWLRLVVLGAFIASLVAGISVIYTLIEPYSAFGRMMSALVAPLYGLTNNLFASVAERADSYLFYSVDVWFKSMPVLIAAIVTFIIITVIAWSRGRLYCNTICPVGTVLGTISRYSVFGIKIDKSKCNGCGLCSKACKSECIDGEAHRVDYSRCVACWDCIGTCKHGAISFTRKSGCHAATSEDVKPDGSRRKFLAAVGVVGTAAAVKGTEKIVDGGLAVIEDKKIPDRKTPIAPPGAIGLNHLKQHCTACQLCISQCPNEVLRPSSDIETLFQPVVSFERGYCRPECSTCSQVCPAGAIKAITAEERTAIQVGHAVWIKENCVPLTDGVECGNCARHCPAGAIMMVPSEPGNEESLKIPAVNAERCIGCGACENLCPSRPFSAIYVEGHRLHRQI